MKCAWLVDTGSDITCVSSKLPGIEKLKLCPTQSAPAAANGSPLGCVGEVVTTVQIGHVLKESVRVLVIQNLNTPAILGIDTLEKFPSFGIDWSNQTLKLGDSNIILEKRRHGSALSPTVISLIADHVIPARSQCFVTTTAKPSYWDKNDSLFTPFNDKMARVDVLLGAGAVSPTQLDAIPITIMNNSEHPVKLYAGTRIGELSPIKVEDRTPTVNVVSREQSSSPMPTKKGPVAVDFDMCEGGPNEKRELKQLLNEYRDVFANNENEVGLTNRTQFKINTKSKVPVAVKLRRTPFALRAEVDKQIKDMEQPYSSPILLVPKPEGSYRFCADFRALNDATITEVFPQPSVRECLDSLQRSCLFTTLDLYSGYWQIPVEKGSRHKTAFSTESGHWHFRVMPFGVKNARAVFARLMTDIMRGLLWNGVAVYLDDIIIGGRNFREHYNLLKDVLQRLREAGLTIKSSKVTLCRKKLLFLGHQVSDKGIEPDPAKVEVIRQWPCPTNTKELRAFLGLCNYYGDFIPNLQERARVLNSLTGKSKFVWTLEREAAFNDLKFVLSSSNVILQFPDMRKPFELSTDASDSSVGCVLSQRDELGRDRPVFFASKALSESELNWHIRDKETFAFVFALRKFRYYLLGNRFIWHTDHEGLRWLTKTRDPRGRYARWIEEFEEFDFEVRYRPGTENPHADALSHVPLVNHVSRDGHFDIEEFKQLQQADPVLSTVISKLKQGHSQIMSTNPEVQRWDRKREYLFLDGRNGLLYMQHKVGKRCVNQLVVPNALVPQVLILKHDNAGHMAAHKTTKLVQREYYWLDMAKDIKEYCSSCVPCAAAQPKPSRPHAPLTVTSQPTEPWQEIAMDLKGPFGTKPTAVC